MGWKEVKNILCFVLPTQKWPLMLTSDGFVYYIAVVVNRYLFLADVYLLTVLWRIFIYSLLKKRHKCSVHRRVNLWGAKSKYVCKVCWKMQFIQIYKMRSTLSCRSKRKDNFKQQRKTIDVATQRLLLIESVIGNVVYRN